jgi:16S rRNA (uracil1498-N3)-methyltransferase
MLQTAVRVMRIPRVFHPDLLAVDQEIKLSQDAANHLSKVLRLKQGHPLVLFNGDGHDYPAQLLRIDKRDVIVKVDAKLSIQVESPLSIHLAQGVSKGDRMDFAIQKAVELGVTEITPIITEFCVVKLSEDRWEKKQNQWQKIVIGACEQCGRNTVPTVHYPIKLQDWLAQSTQQLRLILTPEADKSMQQLSKPVQGVRLLIGPEGGLSDKEVYQARESGYEQVILGPRVLRTETAALASIAVLQGLFGDL